MKNIIAIIGRAGAGKDVAGEYLSKKLGIPSFTISEALKISAREKGINPSRENLISIGKEFFEKYGDDHLAKIIIENTQAPKIIIIGMRQLGQLEYCKNNHNTTFVGIETDSQTRYKRLLKNKKISGDYENFLDIEKLDEGKVQNVGKCLKYCNIIVDNNTGLKELKKSLNTISI